VLFGIHEGAHGALNGVGREDSEGGGGFLEVLAFENPESIARSKFDKGDDGVVTQALLSIINVGVLEVKLSARTPSDKEAREAPALIDSFHKETLAAAKSINERVA